MLWNGSTVTAPLTAAVTSQALLFWGLDYHIKKHIKKRFSLKSQGAATFQEQLLMAPLRYLFANTYFAVLFFPALLPWFQQVSSD